MVTPMTCLQIEKTITYDDKSVNENKFREHKPQNIGNTIFYFASIDNYIYILYTIVAK